MVNNLYYMLKMNFRGTILLAFFTLCGFSCKQYTYKPYLEAPKIYSRKPIRKQSFICPILGPLCHVDELQRRLSYLNKVKLDNIHLRRGWEYFTFLNLKGDPWTVTCKCNSNRHHIYTCSVTGQNIVML